MKKLRKRLNNSGLFAAVLLAAGPAVGHHAPIAFDRGTTVDISGTVARYDWRNPHVYIYLEGSNGSGQSGEWLVEADPTPLMARSGWSATTLARGDAVSLRVFPDRDATKLHGLLVSLTTTDGVTLGMRTGSPETNDATNDISGIWDGLPNFGPPIIDQDVNPPRIYKETALRARSEYSDELYPPAACLAVPVPMLNQLPYLYEIEVHDDRAIIRSEFYAVERVVYMDGRDHPTDGVRSNQGHSIGHWEGDTLVVDTRLFADYRVAHGPGIPAGALKHTVERFSLAADGAALNVETIVEDPEFVSEPYTVANTWAHAPDRSLDPFECDPESASHFILE
jgi:hypothetical protein